MSLVNQITSSIKAGMVSRAITVIVTILLGEYITSNRASNLFGNNLYVEHPFNYLAIFVAAIVLGAVAEVVVGLVFPKLLR